MNCPKQTIAGVLLLGFFSITAFAVDGSHASWRSKFCSILATSKHAVLDQAILGSRAVQDSSLRESSYLEIIMRDGQTLRGTFRWNWRNQIEQDSQGDYILVQADGHTHVSVDPEFVKTVRYHSWGEVRSGDVFLNQDGQMVRVASIESGDQMSVTVYGVAGHSSRVLSSNLVLSKVQNREWTRSVEGIEYFEQMRQASESILARQARQHYGRILIANRTAQRSRVAIDTSAPEPMSRHFVSTGVAEGITRSFTNTQIAQWLGVGELTLRLGAAPSNSQAYILHLTIPPAVLKQTLSAVLTQAQAGGAHRVDLPTHFDELIGVGNVKVHFSGLQRVANVITTGQRISEILLQNGGQINAPIPLFAGNVAPQVALTLSEGVERGASNNLARTLIEEALHFETPIVNGDYLDAIDYGQMVRSLLSYGINPQTFLPIEVSAYHGPDFRLDQVFGVPRGERFLEIDQFEQLESLDGTDDVIFFDGE